MIAPNHGFSGFICGQVALPLLNRYSPLSRRIVLLAFFAGAMMPDLDIVSKVVWGRDAYFGAAFYAHRHASHSLLGTLLMALAAAALLYPWPSVKRFPGDWKAFAWLTGCFWGGGMIHLVGDIFTPGWPLPVFWPYPERYGGWSHIGWFSPYLLWLFVTAIFLGWGTRAVLRRNEKKYKMGNGWASGALWVWYAVAVYRWLHFMATSRYESWGQWVAYHESLLPEAMIVPVTKGVRAIWYWLTG